MFSSSVLDIVSSGAPLLVRSLACLEAASLVLDCAHLEPPPFLRSFQCSGAYAIIESEFNILELLLAAGIANKHAKSSMVGQLGHGGGYAGS